MVSNGLTEWKKNRLWFEESEVSRICGTATGRGEKRKTSRNQEDMWIFWVLGCVLSYICIRLVSMKSDKSNSWDKNNYLGAVLINCQRYHRAGMERPC